MRASELKTGTLAEILEGKHKGRTIWKTNFRGTPSYTIMGVCDEASDLWQVRPLNVVEGIHVLSTRRDIELSKFDRFINGKG